MPDSIYDVIELVGTSTEFVGEGCQGGSRYGR